MRFREFFGLGAGYGYGGFVDGFVALGRSGGPRLRLMAENPACARLSITFLLKFAVSEPVLGFSEAISVAPWHVLFFVVGGIIGALGLAGLWEAMVGILDGKVGLLRGQVEDVCA